MRDIRICDKGLDLYVLIAIIDLCNGIYVRLREGCHRRMFMAIIADLSGSKVKVELSVICYRDLTYENLLNSFGAI